MWREEFDSGGRRFYFLKTDLSTFAPQHQMMRVKNRCLVSKKHKHPPGSFLKIFRQGGRQNRTDAGGNVASRYLSGVVLSPMVRYVLKSQLSTF